MVRRNCISARTCYEEAISNISHQKTSSSLGYNAYLTFLVSADTTPLRKHVTVTNMVRNCIFAIVTAVLV